MDTLTAARRLAADCLCFRARRTARAITRLYEEALRPVGLHAPQLTLLGAVGMAGEDGQTMRRLSEMLAMDLTTLSRNLRPLERDGLVTVGRLEGDRRVRVVHLTAAGDAMLLRALPLWERAHADVVTALGDTAAQALRQSFDAATRATTPFKSRASGAKEEEGS
jgi:DNA-binding MarR family transcriptional regulator